MAVIMKGFLDFIRERGIVGFAVGFILGGAISKLVAGLTNDIINPLLGIVLGKTQGLKSATLTVAGATVAWGDFIFLCIDFLVLSLVVYIGVKVLKLDKLDKPKS